MNFNFKSIWNITLKKKKKKLKHRIIEQNPASFSLAKYVNSVNKEWAHKSFS